MTGCETLERIETLEAEITEMFEANLEDLPNVAGHLANAVMQLRRAKWALREAGF